MKKINHIYSLTPDWQDDLVKDMGAQFLDNKIVLFPDELVSGHSYFTEVTEGVSILLIDYISAVPLEINRLKSDNELYIIQYDLSDEVNLLKIDDITHKIGYSINLGLAVLNNQTDNSFRPVIGKRTFALRLLVDKKLLTEYLKKNFRDEKINKKIKIGKQMLFFYDHIDSNSKLLIHTLRDKSVFDASFEYYIKGIALRLLANFITRYSSLNQGHANLKENEALVQTKNYLLDNLYGEFPSILFLSEMAGMSVAKYNTLFKKLFIYPPNQFYIREKMMLANKLLTSGSFASITEVLYQLNYSKLRYFTEKYFEIHERKPSEDFIKME